MKLSRCPILALKADDELAMEYAIIYPDYYGHASSDPITKAKGARIWNELNIRYPSLSTSIKLVDQARKTLKMVGIRENA